MGHSTSFPEMTASGEAIDTYIQKRNAGLNLDLQQPRDLFNQFITDAFPAGATLNPKAAGEVFDWRQSDENNLDVIAKVISKVADTVTQGLIGEELLPAPIMIGIATTCITDVMGLFTTRTEGTFSSSVREVPLSPGLRMFAVSVSIEMTDTQIFNQGKMVVSWILYKIIFNNELYKEEEKTKILDSIAKLLDQDLKTINDANTKINELEESLLNMDPGPEYDKIQTRVDNDTKILAKQTALVMDLSQEIDNTKTMLLRK